MSFKIIYFTYFASSQPGMWANWNICVNYLTTYNYLTLPCLTCGPTGTLSHSGEGASHNKSATLTTKADPREVGACINVKLYCKKVSHNITTHYPLYNTVHYDMVLDITMFKYGSQDCMVYIEK